MIAFIVVKASLACCGQTLGSGPGSDSDFGHLNGNNSMPHSHKVCQGLALTCGGFKIGQVSDRIVNLSCVLAWEYVPVVWGIIYLVISMLGSQISVEKQHYWNCS